jgi:hypothetical protein
MSRDKNPKRTARREAKQQRRVPPDAVCAGCGKGAPYLMEQHHVMGRAHEPDLTAPLCKNCHAEATQGQLQEEVPLSATDNILDRVAAIFDALAAFFRFLADSFNRLAGQVREFVGNLDGKYPEWRSELSDGS